jgi:hypothetical protein
MICHQRQIRDAQRDDHPVPVDFSQAIVREISYAEAKSVILQYEWLGNMGTTQRAFGLFFDGELAGVECFGKTAGTNVNQSVCGPEYADRVMTLCRGACVSWAHPHSASFLIPRACQLMAKEGTNIVVAYSDVDAGEIGTVYQACNWFYCGTTSDKGSLIQSPEGALMDERNMGHFARSASRNRDTRMFFRKPTRREVRERLIRRGCKFVPRTAKHRYVGIYADAGMRRELASKLRWSVLPYPKRVEPQSGAQ